LKRNNYFLYGFYEKASERLKY